MAFPREVVMDIMISVDGLRGDMVKTAANADLVGFAFAAVSIASIFQVFFWDLYEAIWAMQTGQSLIPEEVLKAWLLAASSKTPVTEPMES